MENKQNIKNPYLRGVQYLLILIPIISFILNVWALLRHGVDVPVYDDWRQYNANDMGRLDLTYLFTPHNDTLYTFGLFLDSLAFRFLDGNTIAYQLLSTVFVLGGMLALQWKLLNLCTKNKSIQVIAFSFTLLMLQPDSYWGWQNLAYHQAIPLVCTLAILFFTLSEKWNVRITIPAIFMLGLASGLSYISGAFAVLTLSAVFLLCYKFTNLNIKSQIFKSGLTLIIPGIATCAAQLWVIIKVQHGTHRADAPMAYPWESDFWYFMLGKIARSLMLPINLPLFSSIIVSLVVLGTVVALGICAIKIKNKTTLENEKASIILISLAGVVFVYLLLISAGRTNLRPETITSFYDIFVYGFYRFHFFWVTLLWPWVACIFLIALHNRTKSNLLLSVLMLFTIAGWTVVATFTPLTSYDSFYKMAMKQRADGIACILGKMQRTGPILCPTVDLSDLTKGLENARNTQASFMRNLPYLPIPLGTDNPRPLYRLSEHFNNINIVNAIITSATKGALTLQTNIDSNIYIKASNPNLFSGCTTLNISVLIAASDNSVAQIFYMIPGSPGYSEAKSSTGSVQTSALPQELNFTIFSANGFESEFRFDPVTADQTITITDLEIRCRALKNN
ncbi:hypothetical protein J2X84_000798 [Pseudomonas corrugata]|uniref:hypothetical protein n=1 Tax=Pseudomonas corrugata TaxID=47879 RepID=UPI0028541DBE|nr:hypothetical protein [Pseudomonas corrugata]MDR7281983.1 hypothetical protein [Pseudomonas corrugata]